MKKVKFWIINELTTTSAEILMYGYIGEYEAIDDAAFLMELRSLEAKYSTILIRVNCGGGDVYKGMTIFNAIKQSKADIKIKIDGIAASMGAVFPMAAKKGNVSASKYARLMTHRVTGFAVGDAEDMRVMAGEMENWEDNIADAIASRTGTTKEDAKKKYIVKKDRWISASEALTEGLIDEIYDAESVTVPEENNPQQIFTAFQNRLQNSSTQKKYNMKKELLKKLNLPDNATDEQIDTAVENALTEKESAENNIKTSATERAKSLVAAAKNKNLITEAEVADYEKQAETNYDFVEKVFNKMQPIKKPTEQINNGGKKIAGAEGSEEQLGKEAATEWEALVAKGDKAVSAFKVENPVQYREMWEAHYKVPFPGA